MVAGVRSLEALGGDLRRSSPHIDHMWYVCLLLTRRGDRGLTKHSPSRAWIVRPPGSTSLRALVPTATDAPPRRCLGHHVCQPVVRDQRAATGLIGYKTWYVPRSLGWDAAKTPLDDSCGPCTCRTHWQLLRENLGRGSSRSLVLKMLALLVESGTIYCLFLVSDISGLHSHGHLTLSGFAWIRYRSSWLRMRRAPRSSPRPRCTRAWSSGSSRTTPMHATSTLW